MLPYASALSMDVGVVYFLELQDAIITHAKNAKYYVLRFYYRNYHTAQPPMRSIVNRNHHTAHSSTLHGESESPEVQKTKSHSIPVVTERRHWTLDIEHPSSRRQEQGYPKVLKRLQLHRDRASGWLISRDYPCRWDTCNERYTNSARVALLIDCGAIFQTPIVDVEVSPEDCSRTVERHGKESCPSSGREEKERPARRFRPEQPKPSALDVIGGNRFRFESHQLGLTHFFVSSC